MKLLILKLIALLLLLGEGAHQEDAVAALAGREQDVRGTFLVIPLPEVDPALPDLPGKDPPGRLPLKIAAGKTAPCHCSHQDDPPARFRSAAVSSGSNLRGSQEFTSMRESISLPLQIR